MGTWSVEPFGNDHAADWAYELEEADDLTPIEAAIEAVLEVGEDYLEAPEGEIALAAIAVLARLHGASAEHAPISPSAEEWVKKIETSPDEELRDKAVAAIDRILADESELRDLWEESNEYEEWKSSVQQLRASVGA